MIMTKRNGPVWLVGAGPGDAGLLTVRACALIAQADVVVHDRLIGPDVLSLIPSHAEVIDVGKRCGVHAVPQEQIQELLLHRARQGLSVVRLKGGDPFLFGRGGEEYEFLAAHGVVCGVVPGVTSALAAPAWAGIPLTHRHCASSIHIITAHSRSGGSEPQWELLASLEGTLVFLMGLSSLERIAHQLMAFGKDETTPVAVVQGGTTSRQKVLRATLHDVARRAEEEKFQSPSVIVVGDVAALDLSWIDALPLSGRLIVVTRSQEKAGSLSSRLADLGAAVVDLPCLSLQADFSDERLSSLQLSQYGWLVFTSPAGVEFFFQWLEATGRDVRVLGDVKIASVGPATTKELRQRGLTVDCQPDVYDGRHLGETLAHHAEKASKLLLLRAADAAPELGDVLKKSGLDFDDVALYSNKGPTGKADLVEKLMEQRQIDAVIFASSSAVEGFCRLCQRPPHLVALCIGPSTARRAEAAGFNVVMAPEATINSLVDTTLHFFGHNQKGDPS